MKKIYGIAFLIFAAALVLPVLVPNEYILRLAVLSGLFILVASAHNILMKVGQLSLGPVAFYGMGAYVSAILSTRYHVPFLVGFLAAGIVAAAAGWIIGRLTLKLRKAYFVLVTIGFAEFFRLVALNWTEMTNGPMGITAIPAPATWFKGYTPYYYAILLLVLAVLFMLHRLENSAIGRGMQAIRENETLGQSVGIDSYRFMMLAAVISSFIIGLAGSFYAHFFQFVGPELLSFDLTITIVIMVIAGGRGTLAGPVLGAILFTIIPELLRAAMEWRMVIYGALLVVIMLYMPDGILPTLVGLFQRLIARWRTKQAASPVVRDAIGEPQTGLTDQPRTVGVSPSSRMNKQATPTDLESDLLQVEDLSVYFGGVHAVDHVSFNICPGEILAIIGPNGAGKTTLLNAITRLGPITSGTIRHKGETINALQAHAVARRRIVRTFQHTSVFPNVTTRRNLILAHNLREPVNLLANLVRTRDYCSTEQECQRRTSEVLKLMYLEDCADMPASSLPYGKQRLLELGIAMATDPALLLLDEPAAGMNATEVEKLIDLILRIREIGVSIILVEHDMRLVMGISDRILVLNYGRQIAMGTPKEIQRNEDVIGAYLGRRKVDAPAD